MMRTLNSKPEAAEPELGSQASFNNSTRSPAAPRPSATGPQGHLLDMQRHVGNRAVQHFLQTESQPLRPPTNSGTPLDTATREGFETELGHDLSHVRIHTHDAADRSARMINARAYTTGRDIVFRRGAYAPSTSSGRHLLAHELAHVVQQRNANPAGSAVQRQAEHLDGTENRAAEREADAVANTVTGTHASGDGLAGRTTAYKIHPTASVLQRQEDDEEAPFERLSQEAQGKWHAVYESLMHFKRRLDKAELASASATRAKWLRDLGSVWTQLGNVETEHELARVRSSLDALMQTTFQESWKAGLNWRALEERYKEERQRLMQDGNLTTVHALIELDGVYVETKRRLDRGASAFLVEDDFINLKHMLDKDTHLLRGELTVARQRSRSMRELFRTLEDIKRAGQDEDQLVPGWKDLYWEERGRLNLLIDTTTHKTFQRDFRRLRKQLDGDFSRFAKVKRPEKAWTTKAFLAAKGMAEGVIDPLVETGKQAVDLVQIAGWIVTAGYYEPKLISDMSKAAAQGQGTWDILTNTITGIAETPERLFVAIAKDDWEAIGRETVNLYLITKAKDVPANVTRKAARVSRVLKARVLTSRAANMLKARAAGWRGGIGAEAALSMRTIVRNSPRPLNIRFRPTGKAAVKLREKGHLPKLEKLKMKTINELDLLIGAKKRDLSKVGFFEPTYPKRLLKYPTEKATQVLKRYEMRKKEWKELQKEVAALVDDGVIEVRGQTIVDANTGKAFTSDYDLFDIRDARTGQPVKYEDLPPKVLKSMEDRKGAVQTEHGALLDWEPVPLKYVDMFADMVRAARPSRKAKPLVEFRSDGTIHYTFFED